MSGPIHNLVKKSLNPFLGVGAVCMACSGVWLITAGHWYVLWTASLAFIFSALIFPLLMLPAGFCAGMMMATEKMNYPRASRIFQTLSFTWLVMLMAGYTTIIFAVAQGYIMMDSSIVLPAVIWSIAASVTPWAFFATRDRDSVFFTGLIYMTALVAAVLFPLALAQGWAMMTLFWLFCLVLGAAVGVQALYEKFFFKP
ncbi:MAG: hypothetical protein Q8K65_05415, partial [Alphaproteobacteria bacterium]|nr:hypothetical protein [Alphaproteobacteria bacterium]